MQDGLPMLVRCPKPECAFRGVQGTTVSRAKVQQLLDKGEDIVVIGGACGHTWSLSATETENLRKVLDG